MRQTGITERERERQKTAPLELVYDTDEILRKRLFVAKPMTLTRSTKLLDEIDDLDDVIHDLFPHLSIKVDFLKQNVTVNPSHISLSLAKKKKRTPLIRMICTKTFATAPR